MAYAPTLRSMAEQQTLVQEHLMAGALHRGICAQAVAQLGSFQNELSLVQDTCNTLGWDLACNIM